MQTRQNDCLKHAHLNNLGIFFLVLFLVFFFLLKSTPTFFVSNTSLLERSLNNYHTEKYEEILAQELNSLTPKTNVQIKDSQQITGGIIAKSYVVYDVKNDKVLFSKNADLVLPLASLTKVVSAVTATKLVNENKIIIIDTYKLRVDEDLSFGLKNGQHWSLINLLKYALTISSNASMDIIASTIFDRNSAFVEKMNQDIHSLGYQHFQFTSASGLDYGNIIGGEGNALEYAHFFAYAYTLIPEIMSYTTHSKINIQAEDKNLYAIPNTNEEAGKTVGLLASKTGFTDLAGGNLAVLINLEVGRPIVIVVLGSTLEGRFQDVDKLIRSTKAALY